MPASETPVTVDLRKLATIVGALVALIGATVLLVGYSRTAAWWLVKDAHSQDQAVAIEAAIVESDARPPRKGAALQKDLTALTELVVTNQALLMKLETVATGAVLLAGAGVCQQAGGSPHSASGTCVFVVGGEAELVPLTDAAALLARIKLSTKAKKALEPR